ncbi:MULTISPECIES: TonB-dependent receptor plug domain-containing protein [Sphingomonas]|uniref:TonB-dependent receptor plug domain-containing protein n=1 Tax=Sphingomonas TaxID=13687 RepID=UPI000700F544|nr:MULTISPECIES: TonB-dependent receptor [Sphingomonas]KQM91024.1 TonB-dependent receptor [Sphingomonas sp. Leaf226]MDY0966572.1 TonB-dependent receptor [Sphingomonas sp. CFBP9021]USR00281.1 TonB-dependent receptor [Sphingomonas aerolata]
MIRYTTSTVALAVALLAGSAAFAATPGSGQDGATPTPAPASAVQESVPDAASATPEPSNDIVVLGTRRTDRTLATSPSPVDVISSAELTSQPAANMIDALKNIVPSFYAGQNSISDASTFVRSPSLRGLSGDQVLVMINGKRYNRSALVQVYGGSDTGLGRGAQGPDISAIPSLAIGNLQVLREGATAQYGSDAIAGVLNYGLREDQGIELVGRAGQYYAGDGESYQIAGNAGVKGDWGFINVTGEYVDEGQTSRGRTRPSAANFAQNFPALANQLPNYPLPVQIWGNSPSHGFKSVYNSAINVTDSSKIYVFANYAQSKGNQSFNYRASVSSTAVDTNGVVRNQGANGAFNNTFFLTPCPAGNATCPSGGFVRDGNTFRFGTLYPAGFTPRFVGKTQEVYGVLGYKGTSGAFSYDLSGTLARNKLSLSMYDSANFSYGPATQTSFDFGDLIQKETNFNADFTYAADLGLAAPLTISAGGEFRKETYEQTAGDTQSYAAGPYAIAQQLFTQTAPGVYVASGTTAAQGVGASGYAGTSPATAGKFSQKAYAAYVGLETDLTDALTVGAAGRYEHYNTFGDAWVGKVNALYKFADAFSVRGSFGTGFHAPSPGQSNVSIVTTSFNNGVAFQAGTYPTNTAVAQYYGASNLTPEKSTNYGLGFILEPVRGMTVTVDGYRINLRNRIGLTSPFIVTAADLAAQPALLPVGVGGQVQYFTNGFKTRTQGIDVVGTYRTRFSEAELNFSLAYNYNDTKVTEFDARVVGTAQLIDAENLAPKHRVVFNAGWTLDNLSLNVRENYYSSFTSAQDYGQTNGVPNQVFSGKFVTDLELSYTFAEHFTVAVGAQNFTDEHPDRLKPTSTVQIYPLTGGTSDGQVYPRNGGPFGFNGGFYYTRLRVKY